MSNNIKVALTYNDNNIGISVFNNVGNFNNVLFSDVVDIEEGIIKNGVPTVKEKVAEITKNLIKTASSFTKCNITSCFILFETHRIEVNTAEMNQIELADGIFNKEIWSKIYSSLNIKQVTDRYIYDVCCYSWKIDDNEYFDLPNERIFGKNLVLKTKVYKVNKVIIKQYEDMLASIGLKANWIKPLYSVFSSLTQSKKSSNNELFIYINENTLSICHTTGDVIMKIDNIPELSLKELFKVMKNEFNIDPEFISQVINQNNNQNKIDFINGYDINNAEFKKINKNLVLSTLEDYAKSIVDCTKKYEQFLRDKKKIKIDKITYVPKDKLTNKIFNFTLIRNKSSSDIFNNNDLNDSDDLYNQIYLAMNYINYEYEKNKKVMNCVDMINDKVIREIFKGEQ